MSRKAGIAILFVGAVMMLIAIVLAVTQDANGQTTCPGHTECVTGAIRVQDPWSDGFPRNQMLVNDKNGAPMFWVNVGATWSGGTPVCITDLKLRPVICLGGPTPENGGRSEVTFYSGGRVVTSLTTRDVQWIHRHGG